MLRQVVRIAGERIERCQTIDDHLIGLFEEDILEVVFVKVRDLNLRRHLIRGLRHLRNRRHLVPNGRQALDRTGLLPVQFTDLIRNRPGHFKVHCPIQGDRGTFPFTLRSQTRDRHVRQRLDRQHDLVQIGGRQSDGPGGGRTSHQRLQLTEFLIEYEQLLSQRRLVVKHVDQQSESPQIVAQTIKGSGHWREFDVDLGDEQSLDAVAHAHDRMGRLIETENRQHAAHLRQQARNGGQWRGVLGIAEKLVERLFSVRQGRAQFTHHRAHGLAVTDPAIKFLHPLFKRLSAVTSAYLLQTVRQAIGPLRQLALILVPIGQCGLEVKHRRCDFQRHLWRRRSA